MSLALGDEFAALLEGEPHAAAIAGRLLMFLQRSAQPVVMIIEDIHWADDATLDLIKVLARRAGQLPLLLILTHREDEPGGRLVSGRVLGSIASHDLIRTRTALPGGGCGAGGGPCRRCPPHPCGHQRKSLLRHRNPRARRD
jgi:hypothetical protein